MNSLVRLESIPKLWTISELLLVLQLVAGPSLCLRELLNCLCELLMRTAYANRWLPDIYFALMTFTVAKYS